MRSNSLKERLEELAMALLSDEHGINEESYNLLNVMLQEVGSKIPNSVDAVDGRFYIPER